MKNLLFDKNATIKETDHYNILLKIPYQVVFKNETHHSYNIDCNRTYRAISKASH